jgi:Fe-S-cluster containining protein
MATQTTSTQRLADVCTRVFKEPAVAGVESTTRRKGVWLETGMAGYTCRQCGRCCLNLDYHSECTAEDYRAWQADGRDDILRWVRRVPGKNKSPAYRIWVAPGTENPISECPFLEKVPGSDKRTCAIHAVKPDICRLYPLTRKHGQMTGCNGFAT